MYTNDTTCIVRMVDMRYENREKLINEELANVHNWLLV